MEGVSEDGVPEANSGENVFGSRSCSTSAAVHLRSTPR